jgi:hypothetical protein
MKSRAPELIDAANRSVAAQSAREGAGPATPKPEVSDQNSQPGTKTMTRSEFAKLPPHQQGEAVRTLKIVDDPR